MNPEVKRLPLDTKGNAEGNRVIHEYHDLFEQGDLGYRCIVPNYGYFYKESLEVYDKRNMEKLKINQDYQVVDFSVEIFGLTGKEACSTIVISNPLIGKDIFITAQMVGGQFVNVGPAIINKLKGLFNNTRKIRYTNIKDVPDTFTLNMHIHPYWDLYSFTPRTHLINRMNVAVKNKVIEELELLKEDFDKDFQEVIEDRSEIYRIFLDHIENKDNPHRVTAKMVDLDKVTNASVGTLDDIRSAEESFPAPDWCTPDYDKSQIGKKYLVQSDINNQGHWSIYSIVGMADGGVYNYGLIDQSKSTPKETWSAEPTSGYQYVANTYSDLEHTLSRTLIVPPGRDESECDFSPVPSWCGNYTYDTSSLGQTWLVRSDVNNSNQWTIYRSTGHNNGRIIWTEISRATLIPDPTNVDWTPEPTSGFDYRVSGNSELPDRADQLAIVVPPGENISACDANWNNTVKYLTPYLLEKFLEHNFGDVLEDHIKRKDNPHRTQAKHVGAYSADEINHKGNQYYNRGETTASTMRLGGDKNSNNETTTQGKTFDVLYNELRQNLNADEIKSGTLSPRNLGGSSPTRESFLVFENGSLKWKRGSDLTSLFGVVENYVVGTRWPNAENTDHVRPRAMNTAEGVQILNNQFSPYGQPNGTLGFVYYYGRTYKYIPWDWGSNPANWRWLLKHDTWRRHNPGAPLNPSWSPMPSSGYDQAYNTRSELPGPDTVVAGRRYLIRTDSANSNKWSIVGASEVVNDKVVWVFISKAEKVWGYLGPTEPPEKPTHNLEMNISAGIMVASVSGSSWRV